jgi:hypothetical protein
MPLAHCVCCCCCSAATLEWSLSASSPNFDNAPKAQADGSYGHWQLSVDQVGAGKGATPTIRLPVVVVLQQLLSRAGNYCL